MKYCYNCIIVLVVLAFFVQPGIVESQIVRKVIHGRLEDGYLSAIRIGTSCSGVLIEVHPESRLTNVAVTAAHCIRAAQRSGSIFVRSPDGKEHEYLIKQAFANPNWEDPSPINIAKPNDIGIIILKDMVDLPGVLPAKLGSAEVGCAYRYVGYGLTENPDEGFGLRKSFPACISEIISGDVQWVSDQAEDAGSNDNGDSGGPLYIEETNTVVSVLSGGNTEYSIGAQVDYFQGFISEVINSCGLQHCPVPLLPTIFRKIAVNREFQHKFEALYPNPEDVTYAIEGFVPGMHFDQDLQLFTWTPNSDLSGRRDLTVTAADGFRKSTSKMLLYLEPEDYIEPESKVRFDLPSGYIGEAGEVLEFNINVIHQEEAFLFYNYQGRDYFDLEIEKTTGQVRWEFPLQPGFYPLFVGVEVLEGAEVDHYHMPLPVQVVNPGEINFLRGDANVDGKIDISDPIFLFDYLFQGGDLPVCSDAADANDDSKVDQNDANDILSHLFDNGSQIVSSIGTWEIDETTNDPLNCAFYPVFD
jgi:hypothetical protein